MTDCIECGKQLSSPFEISGKEICYECDADEQHGNQVNKDLAVDDVVTFMFNGWGSLSAAMKVQKQYNLSDSDVDDVALQAERIYPDAVAEITGRSYD